MRIYVVYVCENAVFEVKMPFSKQTCVKRRLFIYIYAYAYIYIHPHIQYYKTRTFEANFYIRILSATHTHTECNKTRTFEAELCQKKAFNIHILT